MKFSNTLIMFIPIVAFLILLFIFWFLYVNNIGSTEGLTNTEAEAIMPVLYDSSLSSKTKITDLLGIPVNDASFNQILTAENKDPDAIIATIKRFIGSSFGFKTTPTNVTETAKTKETTPLESATTNTPSSTNATTTTPATIKHSSFKDRITKDTTK